MVIMYAKLRTYRRRSGLYYSTDMKWRIERIQPFIGPKRWDVSHRFSTRDFFDAFGSFKTLSEARAFIQEKMNDRWM
jgi:hypothetical protein